MASKVSAQELRHAQERVEKWRKKLARAKTDAARKKARDELSTAEYALKIKKGWL